MRPPVRTILIPTRPQPDTVVAIFILKKFGQELFPGIETSTVEVRPTLPEHATLESCLDEGLFPLDIGGGMFDHHGKKDCATELVVAALGKSDDAALGRMVAFAVRDDKHGKGTLSTDAIDRAFGLSGLISSLNKAHPKDAHFIVHTIAPLLEAHYLAAYEHYVALPKEVDEKKRTGQYREITARGTSRSARIACVVSDRSSMATFLRSAQGQRADIVLQKTESTGHVCVLTHQTDRLDLSMVASLIRLREAEIAGITLPNTMEYVAKTGRIAELPMWYYDPATNSLLNGGIHATDIAPTNIEWDELSKIVQAGIEMIL